MFAVCYMCVSVICPIVAVMICYCFGVLSLVQLSSYNNDYETEPCDPLLA